MADPSKRLRKADGTIVCIKEQPVPAWLVIQSDGTRSVHLSPLTDDVYMDEGAEAWPLYRTARE